MDEFLYASEYYCDEKECQCYHPVSCWWDSATDKYYVTDSDGNTLVEYDSQDEMLADYPEGNPNTAPKPKQYKKEKWFAVITPNGGNVEVTSVKKGGRWNKNWRNEGLSPSSAPDEVRLILGLSDVDKSNNVIEGLSKWEDVVAGVKTLDGGKVYDRSTVISFNVEFEV